jgi:hypothetical protein
MKNLLPQLILLMGVSTFVFAQNFSSTVDVLGAHNNQGRGCAGCHAPHSGSFGAGEGGAPDAGSYALWGQDASPLYGKTVLFGDHGQYVEVLPNGLSTGGPDVTGILMCLSCHDGNLTHSNMMQDWSYEQQIGLIKNTTYGNQKIPTLLGNDGSQAGMYTNDHPVGQNVTIDDLTSYGLVFSNNSYTVTPGSQYATFMMNYGAPDLSINLPFPNINGAGKAYVTCTTCHNQHSMTVFIATVNNPIQGHTSGYYETFFFINAPYNPNIQGYASNLAPSTSQFCRQCHFNWSNEAGNTNNIGTVFQ